MGFDSSLPFEVDAELDLSGDADGRPPAQLLHDQRAGVSATDVVRMRSGETLKVRFIGSNNGFVHPMHINEGPFQAVAVNGEPLAPTARYMADTVMVGPGQRYDVIWKARKPGRWLIHCHSGHHTTNNNVEMRGGGGPDGRHRGIVRNSRRSTRPIRPTRACAAVSRHSDCYARFAVLERGDCDRGNHSLFRSLHQEREVRGRR